MRGWRTISLTTALAASLQVGCDGSECGNGVVGPLEDCDDGNTEDGDGCNSSCVIEPGWSCINEDCAPACGDGIFVGAPETCDPSHPNWVGYCSEDCRRITGWCGDGIAQPEQEDCDGVRGCRRTCEPAFGFQCDAPAGSCVASGVAGDRPMNDLSREEWTAYCEWFVEVLGGAGDEFTCESGWYVYTFRVRYAADCVMEGLRLSYATCTVGDMEDFVAASGGHRCSIMLDNPRCMG